MAPIKKLLLNNKLFVLILVLGIILRTYKFQELFAYSHDQDLLGWFIRDVLENKHWRLIGQETSSPGVFIGPLFYYLLIPFYVLAGMDPIGGIWFSVICSMFTIFSFYFVFRKIFGRNIGLIASFVYAVSFYSVFTDREVVPTQPAMLWSVWFLYSVHLLLKNKQKLGFLLAGVLIGLIWHINLALMLLLPIIPFALLLSRKKIKLKPILLGLAAALILLSPIMLFELKHNFQQVGAVVVALTTDKSHLEGTGRGFAKLDRTMQLVNKNTTRLFFPFLDQLTPVAMTLLLIVAVAFLCIKKIFDGKLAFIIVSWQVLFVVFFTLNPINLSEYYINGMNVIWIGIFAVFLGFLLKKLKFVGLFILATFAFIHIYAVASIPVDASGYVQKKQLIEFIIQDSSLHRFPCVAVSYITDPGRELGYRYLFWQAKLRVNQPKSGSPVYTIVFPHSKVDKIDKSFGSLGLILPEYEIYSQAEVDQSCSGEDSNLTDPLFGFTR